jgi:putative DeoR family transcriptional regulator (stage III sporulation protein D)
MQDYIIDRVLNEAIYIIKTKKTVREMSKVFSVSKSTIHKDLAYRLREIDSCLFDEVRAILDPHRQDRHLRGGAATCEKYRKLRESSDDEVDKKKDRDEKVRILWF